MVESYQLQADEVVVLFRTTQTDYREGCEQGIFSAVMADSGAALDTNMFTFVADSDGQSTEAKIIIRSETADSSMVGDHVIIVTEKSSEDPSIFFQTQLTVTVMAFCQDAQIVLSLDPWKYVYLAGDSPIVFDLEEVENGFAVDSNHADSCSPIYFTYTPQITKGELDISESLSFDLVAKLATFSTPSIGQGDATFVFFVEGQIMGNPDYATVSHEIQVTVKSDFSKEHPEDDILNVSQTVGSEESPISLISDSSEELGPIQQFFYSLEQRAPKPIPVMDIVSLTRTGLLTLFITEPLVVPPWPETQDLTDQEVIE